MSVGQNDFNQKTQNFRFESDSKSELHNEEDLIEMNLFENMNSQPFIFFVTYKWAQ